MLLIADRVGVFAFRAFYVERPILVAEVYVARRMDLAFGLLSHFHGY
jgi:hypothetical protein